MLVENQKVEVKWNNNTKKHYVDKGYCFTKLGDTFLCDVNDLIKGSKIKVLVKCDYCNNTILKAFENYNIEIQKSGKCACYNCRAKKRAERDIITRAEKAIREFYTLCEQYDYDPISTIEDYKDSRSKLFYNCKIHGIQTTLLSNFRKGEICAKCAKDHSYDLSERRQVFYKEYMNFCELNDYIPTADISDYYNYNSEIEYTCKKHGKQYITLNGIRSLKYGCRSCAIEKNNDLKRLDKDIIEKLISSKNNNVLLNCDDYQNMHSTLSIKCGSCENGVIKTNLNNYLRETFLGKCSVCSAKSVGEAKISAMLNLYNFTYIPQYTFAGCRDKKPLPFDFYLPDYNLCIEFDGIQHFKPLRRTYDMTLEEAQEKLKYIQYHDRLKTDYCLINKINLLRIPYYDFKNINSIILKYLGLSRSIQLSLKTGKIFICKSHNH